MTSLHSARVWYQVTCKYNFEKGNPKYHIVEKKINEPFWRFCHLDEWMNYLSKLVLSTFFRLKFCWKAHSSHHGFFWILLGLFLNIVYFALNSCWASYFFFWFWILGFDFLLLWRTALFVIFLFRIILLVLTISYIILMIIWLLLLIVFFVCFDSIFQLRFNNIFHSSFLLIDFLSYFRYWLCLT